MIELALNFRAIGVYVDACAVLLIIIPLTIIDIFFVHHLTSAIALVVVPFAFITGTVFVDHRHVFSDDILLPEGDELVTIYVGNFTLAFSKTFDKEAFKKAAIIVAQFSFTIRRAMAPVSLILTLVVEW